MENEILSALKQMKQDIMEMKDSIIKTINESFMDKFETYESKNQELTEKMEKQEIKISKLEKQARRRNLVFFGLEETEQNNYKYLEKTILDLIQNKMQLKCQSNEIEYIRRIGKDTKTRPVVVTFVAMGKKIEILKNKNILNNTSIYIKEDYPRDILNKRKQLQEQLKQERKQGKNAILKYDKIIIIPDNYKNDNNMEWQAGKETCKGEKKKEDTVLKKNKKQSKKLV